MKPYQTLLYYKYTRIPDAEEFAAQHLEFCERLGVVGRIIVAEEGLNGTISGTVVQCKKYMDTVRSNPLFEGIEFKIDEVDAPSFERLYVRFKPEIVHSSLRGIKNVDPNEVTGIHLKPHEVDEMIEQDDVVFVDVRSNYESNVGHFKNALKLDIDNFRDFPEQLKQLEHLKDKKVVTYCTGGIKCEKASGYLLQNGFKNVYQVDGGVVKYAKETGGKNFEGKLYVFDNRVVVDVNKVQPSIVSACKICGTPSAHVVNCANAECNEHFVLCETCGWKMEGCCSEACMTAPAKRPYDGTGYYQRESSTVAKH
ncbi:MAG TPA: rhodanese-related sulfurtransferase [Chitinophagales bacterium]|nr:rhodanese-related sulfurtransferase [Chitinophagales bacterium]